MREEYVSLKADRESLLTLIDDAETPENGNLTKAGLNRFPLPDCPLCGNVDGE